MAQTRLEMTALSEHMSALIENVSAQLTEKLIDGVNASNLFPGGITKISASIEVANVGSVSLEIEGPAGTSSNGDNSSDNRNKKQPITAPPLPPAPTITKVSPPNLKQGAHTTLVIEGTNFKDDPHVLFEPPALTGIGKTISATRIEVDVLVDDPVLKPLPLDVQVQVIFNDNTKATSPTPLQIRK